MSLAERGWPSGTDFAMIDITPLLYSDVLACRIRHWVVPLNLALVSSQLEPVSIKHWWFDGYICKYNSYCNLMFLVIFCEETPTNTAFQSFLWGVWILSLIVSTALCTSQGFIGTTISEASNIMGIFWGSLVGQMFLTAFKIIILLYYRCFLAESYRVGFLRRWTKLNMNSSR